MAGTRRKPGVLGPYVEDYRWKLMQAGYTSGSTCGKLREFGRLGRWMSESGVAACDLDEHQIDRFVAYERAGDGRCLPGPRSLGSVLELLGELGVAGERQPRELTPTEELVARYRTWMVNDRGLAEMTVLRYANLALRFLEPHVDDNGEAGLAGLSGGDVTTFLLGECGRVSVGSAKGRVAELRSLLRFLYVAGITPMSLAGSVPAVAGWQHTGIPQSMTTEDVERLLDSCDRTVPLGMRDFAILMLVSRLGLRSIEIARMELDDLDWRGGEFVVRGKARRVDRLPLPAEVGQALADYLAHARPESDHRKVFVTARAPYCAIRADLVSDVVRRACRRAGLAPVGAHRLRHALATGMLAAGVELTAISQVLRHSDIATTAIYAKVDIVSLRQVAAPWPGARP